MEYSKINTPLGIHSNALTGYIHTATLCTTNLEGYKKFYGEAMKMEFVGPLSLTDNEKKLQKVFWNIPVEVDYDMYHCYRGAVPSLIQLRILHLKTPTPQIHKSYSSYEAGSFSLGFPTTDAVSFDERLRGFFNVETIAPMLYGEIDNGDGTFRKYIEAMYKGPDYLHCVGIERVDQTQLAPCNPIDGLGGPGYSAFVAMDSDAEASFYTDVLEHELLFDTVWEAGEDSPLEVPEGTPFRFTGIYAPNAQQNHVLLLDFKDGNMIDTGVQSCVPNQGLGMYTFQTADIDKVLQNAKEKNITIKSETQAVSDYILGDGQACLLETPNGFYIEIFQSN